ncbi:MAG TPA: glycosyltransferase [Chthonomonadaceae bacterium]|nr:glycosyltransferase [Chthonomonadaceae bacterium]
MKPQTVAVIIEWENARLSKMARSRAMLRQLAQQAHQLFETASSGAGRPEPAFLSQICAPLHVIILYPEGETEADTLTALLSETIRPDDPAICLRLLPVSGQHYYQIKNTGAQVAESDLLIFLDSDVIPEENWLVNLLSAFADPQVQVVGSNVYMDTSTLYARAFALGWFFELRRPDGPLQTRRSFYANSVAFRKPLFVRYGFPTIEGTSRGSCRALGQKLTEEGIPIFYSPSAHINHPAPNGWGHFFLRGIAEGRDENVMRPYLFGDRYGSGLRGAFGSFKRQFVSGMRSICRNYPQAHMKAVEVPFAMGLMAFYYSLILTGDLLTHFFPNAMRRRFHV